MEEEKDKKQYDLRSEEVQEIMRRIPSSILRYGITVIFVILVAVFAGSYWFSYPDIVSAPFVLHSQQPPAYLLSKRNTKIKQLLINDKSSVRKGQSLAVFDNVASSEDIFKLKARLRSWKNMGGKLVDLNSIFFKAIPQLGSVQSAYNSCSLTWNTYLEHLSGGRNYATELTNSISLVDNALSEWEENYLLASPIDGKVSFMQQWKVNQYVEADETLFVVLPMKEETPVGSAILPMQSVAQVEIGQRTMIKLVGFPEQEYGHLVGKVSSISPVPDKNGNYILEIEMPNGLVTNYKHQLPLIKRMTGTADIVTEERNLLSRLLNLR